MSERPPIVDLHIAGVGAARFVRSDEHRVVYRAPHETRGHDVDVEIIPGSQGEAARARFAREHQALGRLAGVEGVVPLLEAGVTIDGDLYLMTPTLGGRTLAEIIATDGPMAWPEATRIVEAAAATLHHAHVVGVTHRRIGPDTIVVTDDGRVLITGLGSAGLTVDAAGSSLPAVDRPGYRPPEWSRATADGDAGKTAAADSAVSGGAPAAAYSAGAGPAGDIYGLGATLWALLAGRPPFTRADTGADDPTTIAQRAATTRVGDLRSVAPASVAEAVEWATTIEPERRPSSASTFARALREAASRAPSGFIADPDAVVAGWRPLHAPEEVAPATAAAAHHPPESIRDTGDDTDGGIDDGRRAGLLVGLGIAAIALVALAASAVLVAFVGEDESVTISGPSIESGEDEVPAEVLGVEVEADTGDRGTAEFGSDAVGDEAQDGTGGDPDARDDGGDGQPGDDADGSVGQSAVIEPFAIPTPTPVATVATAAPPGGAAVAGPTQPPAASGPTATPTPGTTISAPPPPSLRPTPTPDTVISAPPAPPPAPTSSPTPMPTPAPPTPTATAVPPTATPVGPTPTPVETTPTPTSAPTTDPLGVVVTPN